MIKIVFFGTPSYVLPVIELLHKTFKDRGETPIEAVVTQSPKPTGRKQIVEYSPVDKWAFEKKVPVYFDSKKLIQDKIRADVGVLASYGALIPTEVINYFPKGILVIHPSILPEFRGSSPVPAMILTNTKNVGCSIFKMDEKWDHGAIVAQFKDEILEADNMQTLRDRLFERSAEVLVSALPAYLNGKINLISQDDEKSSFARMIEKEDAFLDPKALGKVIEGKSTKEVWNIEFIKTSDGKPYTTHYSPTSINQFISAMNPSPGAWTNVRIGSGKDIKTLRLKILNAHISQTSSHNSPSQRPSRAGGTQLILDTVQLEGKNPVTWEQFEAGYPNYKFE